MAQYKVSVTDYNFPSLDIEKAILEPMGCELASLKTGKDHQELCTLVKEADCVITQFAPVNAAVIEAMERCKVIVRYGIGVDNVDLRAAAAKNTDTGSPTTDNPRTFKWLARKYPVTTLRAVPSWQRRF